MESGDPLRISKLDKSDLGGHRLLLDGASDAFYHCRKTTKPSSKPKGYTYKES